jgi:hypothetical protein
MKERVRRADLYLRRQYPHLDTRIFRLPYGFYGILIKDFTGNFSELQNEFDNAIKPVATPAMLINKIPDQFEEEIPVIKDDEIGKSFAGMPLTFSDLQYLLMAKFPTVEIVHLETFNREQELNIYTNEITEENIKKEIIDFSYGLDIFMKCHLIENSPDGLEKEKIRREEQNKAFASMKANNPAAKEFLDGLDDPIMHSFPSKMNRTRIVYEERDEQMWFDKIGEIYAGNFTKNDIIKDADTANSCYVDYAVFDNVNIRNGIVLYDRIFVEPPVDSGINAFCSAQKIKSDEIIQLCKENKLFFVLPQPSFRYDSGFFTELFKINPDCILSKRALSALIICDLVEINKNYFVNTLEIGDSIYEISRIIKEIDNNYSKTNLYDIYMWPQKALRSALEVFLFGSTYRMPQFGINKLITDTLTDEQKKKIELEFLVNSDKVHISSALNTHYFPHFEGEKYSNQYITSVMGNMLNLYKNSTVEKMQNYVAERQKIIADRQILPVSLIEVDEYVSVAELNSLSKEYFSAGNFTSILGYLLGLSSEDMERKIVEYNALVEKEINRRKKITSAIDFSITAGTDALGLVIPFVSTGVKILDNVIRKTGLSKSKNIEKIRAAFFKIGQKYDEKKAISFLTKINSVARLRKKYE